MSNLSIWVPLAWIGGTAAILGSLMTIASLLLWLIPTTAPNAWQNRLKVTGFAILLAIAGFATLAIAPPIFSRST